ncbi:GreA/GreB family elongation factor [Sphingomonas abietis]|uniref:GreA/GreB family elongation factor n=1 Tax=Sphingomonas abietis TaxID=3012344 RepID=A0ABY7NPI4_9SPHN|nr:GreA/GreB family elongation factor [Sphingomonas abietis]WBO23440.1 GreA/GreB family elongation factor [Sphingomonas abietis]
MSVAFRRDGDEEHKEPKFELPLPAGPNLVTARGLALIEAKVAELEAADTAALAEADREQHLRTLRYWRTRQATAQPVSPPADDEIAFGSRVAFTLNGQTKQIDIVGDDEAEPHAGRIAFSAPLARAMIGAYPGEQLAFGGKADALEILSAGAIPA